MEDTQGDKLSTAEKLEQRAAHNAAVDQAHEAMRPGREARNAAAAERPPIRDTTHPEFDAEAVRAWNEVHPAPPRPQNEKPAPCPCADSPVTLEQIDQRVAALGRFLVVCAIAAAVIYALRGREQAAAESE